MSVHNSDVSVCLSVSRYTCKQGFAVLRFSRFLVYLACKHEHWYLSIYQKTNLVHRFHLVFSPFLSLPCLFVSAIFRFPNWFSEERPMEKSFRFLHVFSVVINLLLSVFVFHLNWTGRRKKKQTWTTRRILSSLFFCSSFFSRFSFFVNKRMRGASSSLFTGLNDYSQSVTLKIWWKTGSAFEEIFSIDRSTFSDVKSAAIRYFDENDSSKPLIDSPCCLSSPSTNPRTNVDAENYKLISIESKRVVDEKQTLNEAKVKEQGSQDRVFSSFSILIARISRLQMNFCSSRRKSAKSNGFNFLFGFVRFKKTFFLFFQPRKFSSIDEKLIDSRTEKLERAENISSQDFRLANRTEVRLENVSFFFSAKKFFPRKSFAPISIAFWSRWSKPRRNFSGVIRTRKTFSDRPKVFRREKFFREQNFVFLQKFWQNRPTKIRIRRPTVRSMYKEI